MGRPVGTAPSVVRPASGGRESAPFTFVDLFAGIGGFHAALSALGGRCVYASEIDLAAARVYERNWGLAPAGDIVEATEQRMDVPEHDVLVAGFPCQPFSKSGMQRGMDEARGTLFWNILRVVEERSPSVVLLENVRNLAGPRHRHEWHVIIKSLRQLGYRVSSAPAVFSPHLLPPDQGGRPQVRERVFIAATRVEDLDDAWTDMPPVVTPRAEGWDPSVWDIEDYLDPEGSTVTPATRMTAAEVRWVSAWDDFVQSLRRAGELRLPGFPIWADEFRLPEDLVVSMVTPTWKAGFLRKNAVLYARHRDVIDAWLDRWDGLEGFPPSRRKLEWQAQDATSLWDTVLHFRPSGIRAKRATYLPALVAITQTSVVASRRRRLTVREAARLQGLPEWFDFGDQRDAASFKQLGNAVNVGVVHHVLRQHVLRDADLLGTKSPLVRAAAEASPDPSALLDAHRGRGGHLEAS
ncbi:DNA cytosine methyltransferase [Aquipuribacter sp. SD81]|uniref:DNA cytosine methyltransferase n=1 Tax=Aquipuribacter sp. SD81 TaxID=3127703 RepID=UPI0030161127